MKVFRSWASLADCCQLQGCVITVGNFDGVHLGHQHLIQQLSSHAERCVGSSLVVTFYPHPRTLLNPKSAPKQLQSLHDRLHQLRQTGVDAVLLLPFTHELATWTPQQFIKKLYQSCQMKHMHVGHDFAFGKNRSGQWQDLKKMGRILEFGVSKAGAFSYKGKTVSSSAVRQSILKANFQQANELLGRRYSISGHVGSGDQRGREIGFRTANMSLAHYCHPPVGIYAVWVCSADQHWAGAAYIGTRPTFSGHELRLETTLLDVQVDLYHQRLDIQFVAYLRGDVIFENTAQLAKQISMDCQQVKAILQNHPFLN